MRKSIIVLLIVGAFFAGTLVVPDFASADPEQQVQLDALINIVGILFNGINSGFATVADQIADIQLDVDVNTQKSSDNMMDITDNANAITAIGPHTVDTDTTFDGTDFALSGQSCPGGQKATGVDASGFVICAVDIDTDTDTLTGLGCTNNQIAQFVGSVWTCVPIPAGGGDTVTSVDTGVGLTGGPITSTGTISIDTAVVPQLGIENTFTNDMNIAGELFLDGDLSVGEGLGNDDDTIFFDEEGDPATLRWDDFDDRFEFSNELAMQAPILIGSNTFSPVSYNRFTTPGDGSNISTHGLAAFSDLFIGASLEVDGPTFFDGQMTISPTDTSTPLGIDRSGDGPLIVFTKDAGLVEKLERFAVIASSLRST